MPGDVSNALRIVIPVIDEAKTLPGLLGDLAGQQGPAFEVVVVDGGSTDATRRICIAHGGRWLASPPGRARQMNAGAADFAGEWLLFLHADSRLTALDQIDRAVRCLEAVDGECFGHFPLRFVHEDRRPADGFLYRYMAAKSGSDRRYTINGDQGLLIRRRLFDVVDGFDARLPFLEDQRLIETLRPQATTVCLPHRLETSARRFVVEGPGRRYLLMGLIMAMYVAGTDRFFEHAPGLYVRQAETATLRLAPFVETAVRSIGALGAVQGGLCLWRLASAVAGQTWQGALALDVLFDRERDGTGPGTRWHDAWLAPLIDHPLTRILLFCLLAVAVFGLDSCFRLFRLRDHLPTIKP